MTVDKAALCALSGDPRRPDSVVPFTRPPPPEDKLDILSSAAMMFAIIGVMLKARLFAYVALAFVASAYVQRGPDTDSKTLFSSAMCAIVGLFFSHVNPSGAPARNATAATAAS